MPDEHFISLHSLNLPSARRTARRSDQFIPVQKKDGTDVLVCGTCGLKLAENVTKEKMRYTFLACPRCCALNEMPD